VELVVLVSSSTMDSLASLRSMAAEWRTRKMIEDATSRRR